MNMHTILYIYCIVCCIENLDSLAKLTFTSIRAGSTWTRPDVYVGAGTPGPPSLGQKRER